MGVSPQLRKENNFFGREFRALFPDPVTYDVTNRYYDVIYDLDLFRI